MGQDSWTVLTPRLPGLSPVLSLAVFGGEIYAGGNNGILYKWDGVDSWVTLISDPGGTYSNDDLIALTEIGGELYAVLESNPGLVLKYNGTTTWSVTDSFPFTSTDFAAGDGTIVDGTTIFMVDYDEFCEFAGSSVSSPASLPGGITDATVPVFLGDYTYISSGDATTDGELWRYDPGVPSFTSVSQGITNGVIGLSLTAALEKIYATQATTGDLHEWNGVDAWAMVAPEPQYGLVRIMVEFKGGLYGCNDGALVKWNGVDAWVQVADDTDNGDIESNVVTIGDTLYAGTRDGILLSYSNFEPIKATNPSPTDTESNVSPGLTQVTWEAG